MKKIISLLASTAIMLMVLPAGTAMATGSCTFTDSGGATETFNQGTSDNFDLSNYMVYDPINDNDDYLGTVGGNTGVICMVEKGLIGYVNIDSLAQSEAFAAFIEELEIDGTDFFTWLQGLDGSTTMGSTNLKPSQWFDTLIMREYASVLGGQKANRSIYSEAALSVDSEQFSEFSVNITLPTGYALYHDGDAGNGPEIIQATDNITYDMVELRKQTIQGGTVIDTEFAGSFMLLANAALDINFASNTNGSFFDSVALSTQRSGDSVGLIQMTKTLDQNDGLDLCLNPNIVNNTSWSCSSSSISVFENDISTATVLNPYEVSQNNSYLFKMNDEGIDFIFYQGLSPIGLESSNNSGNGGEPIPEFSDYVLMSTLLILGYAMRNRIPKLKDIVNK